MLSESYASLAVVKAPAPNLSSTFFRIKDSASRSGLQTDDLRILLSISKELRTPLQRISAPIEQLLRADAVLSESERKYLYGVIGLQTSKMLDLVEQLLNPGGLAVQNADLPQEADAEPFRAAEDVPAPAFNTSLPVRKPSTNDEALLGKLYSIMEDNLEETGFNVHKMCSMVHLSHMHFIRKVKQLTGQKPIDLLKSFRLKRAKELLQLNNYNVAEVAYKVGYDMPNSFSRAFKKEFGISPTAYIQNLQHQPHVI